VSETEAVDPVMTPHPASLTPRQTLGERGPPDDEHGYGTFRS